MQVEMLQSLDIEGWITFLELCNDSLMGSLYEKLDENR